MSKPTKKEFLREIKSQADFQELPTNDGAHIIGDLDSDSLFSLLHEVMELSMNGNNSSVKLMSLMLVQYRILEELKKRDDVSDLYDKVKIIIEDKLYYFFMSGVHL